jgi:hypothetical protein
MLKDELEAIISSDEAWSTRCTFVLAIGIVGEYVVVKWLEHLSVKQIRILFKAARATILTKWTKRTRIVLEILFAMMVVAGVGGEYGFSARIAKNANLLQQLADKDLADAQDVAATASQRAGRANTRAAQAIGQATNADARTLREIDARLAIEKQLKLQGPRWLLLESNKAVFVKALLPFAGQPITVMDCGLNPEPEAYRLAQEMMNFLSIGDDSAHWKLGYKVWERCGPGGGTSYGGNMVATNSMANDSVKRARTALYDVLNQIGISTVRFEAEPAIQHFAEMYWGPGSPMVMAQSDANTIFLLIGTNPMFDVSGFDKPKTLKK